MNTNRKNTILLVDDHTLFRTGLRYLIETSDSFEVIGEADDGLDGIKKVQALRPDLVLLDIDMPTMRGTEALAQMLNFDSNLAIVMLTVSEDSNDLTECMQLGAKGFLLKNVDANFLLDSLKRVLDGDSILSPEMTIKLIEKIKNYAGSNKPDNAIELLTPREKEILGCLARGVSNKVIAREFDVAESTVKVHVQNILRKLNLTSRVQAAVYAVENCIG